MKYVITVMKASGTRKVLETHEFKGAILEDNVINECCDIAKKSTGTVLRRFERMVNQAWGMRRRNPVLYDY